MAGRKISRLPALMAGAALALAIVASAFAQAPAAPLSQHWGAAASSGAVLDGQPAPDAADQATTTASDSPLLPETGSDGLAGRGNSLPVTALIFTISMLAGMAGVMAVRRIRA
jgi:hypothetical protein